MNRAILQKVTASFADVNLRQKDVSSAEENLNTAYKISKRSSSASARHQSETGRSLCGKQNFEKAIEAKKKVLKEDFVKENSQEKVNQIQELADIYIKKNDPKEAVDL